MKKNLGLILAAGLCVLLLPFAALSATLALKSGIHPDKVATVLGFGPLIVDTGSMRPEFRENDLLIMQKTDAGALQEQDIIAYYDAKGTVVTHRIIGIEAEEGGARKYITKGDANNVKDGAPVPAERVAGLIVRVIPNGGKTMRSLSRPTVTVAAIALPLGLFYGGLALQKKLAQRKRKEAVADIDTAQPL